jgi:tetratricopeptide (TPR) repeat protein
MTEEPTVQCENCGTLYNDLEEVCPYCGQSRPVPADDYPGEDDLADLLPDETFPFEPDELLPAEDYTAGYPDDLPQEEEFSAPDEQAYLAEDDLGATDNPFPDDDIFAVAGPEWAEDYPDYGEPLDDPNDQPDELYDDEYDDLQPLSDEYDEPADEDDYELDEESEARRFTKRRFALGCLGILLCAGLFYGGIGLMGVFHGLQERTQQIQVDAETHYRKGQQHLTDESYELAIAEFELALSLNPNFLAAREALRDAQRTAQAQPTPTSETRSAAAKAIFSTAETHLTREDWAEAVEVLSQLRDLDPDFRPEQVSELVYTANYQLGFQLLNPDQIEEAVQAFETALSEQPEDQEIKIELVKALLYIDGRNAEQTDKESAIDVFAQLYREDADYLDVKERLLEVYEAFGDELFEQEEWCLAEAQYVEAALIQPDSILDTKIDGSTDRCQQTPRISAQANGSTPGPQARATPARRGTPGGGEVAATSSLTGTGTVQAASAGSGKIYFSAFNTFESLWEILAVPAGGGPPEVVTIDGTMPAVSPNGQLLVYRSEAQDSIGFHLYDLTTGEDRRITTLKQHALPRWGGDNTQFLLVAQEPGTGLWKIQQGFADGKSDPIDLRVGRTPDWSPDNSLIAYQGTDPAGNEPGIYLVPFGGGETTRLTNHESDRSPDFSPDGSRLAYMSTRDGDWDIYTISTAGSAPRQLTISPSQEGLPVWSPDGSSIAYVSDAGGSWNIYTISADGGSPTRVTAWDGLNRPDWLMTQISWGR